MDTVSKSLFSSLVELTKNLQKIDSDDIAFFKTSEPGFNDRINSASLCVLEETAKLLQYIGRSSKGLPTPANLDLLDDITDNYDTIVDVLDTLLEKADIYLDEASGKFQTMGVVAQQQKFLKSGYHASSSLSKRKQQFFRPQLDFEDKIDNSNTPFVPKINSKPNALRPLPPSLSSNTDVNNTNDNNSALKLVSSKGSFSSSSVTTNNQDVFLNHIKNLGYGASHSHPYEYEIKNIKYPQSMFGVRPEMMYDTFENTPFCYVNTINQLNEMMHDLKQASEIAVDTEHHDFRSFQGFICLIQISSRTKDWIIDALALRSHLNCLNEVFTDPAIVKVFHGADSDVQWLQRDFGVYLVNMFDTYHASHALEMPQHGLAYLLDFFCSVKANKKYQLADWRKRPLTEEMLDYARTDTHYLLYIYDKMRNELLSKDPETYNLLRVTLENSANTTLRAYEKPFYDFENGLGPGGWKNALLKFGASMDLVQLEVFKALHAWRDQIARKEDESVRFVMPNHALFNLSTRMPKDGPSVLGCCHPPSSLIRLHSTELSNIIEYAVATGKQRLEERNASLIENLKFPAKNIVQAMESEDLLKTGVHTKFDNEQKNEDDKQNEYITESDIEMSNSSNINDVIENQDSLVFPVPRPNPHNVKVSWANSSSLFPSSLQISSASKFYSKELKMTKAMEKALEIKSTLILIAPSFEEPVPFEPDVEQEESKNFVTSQPSTPTTKTSKTSSIVVISDLKNSMRNNNSPLSEGASKRGTITMEQLDSLIDEEASLTNKQNRFKKPKLIDEEYDFDNLEDQAKEGEQNIDLDAGRKSNTFDPFSNIEDSRFGSSQNKKQFKNRSKFGNKSMSFSSRKRN